MSALAPWRDLDANPLSLAACRERAALLRDEADLLRIARQFDRIERPLRAADRFDSVARRLDWCRPPPTAQAA